MPLYQIASRALRPAAGFVVLGLLAACAGDPPQQYVQPTQSSKTVPAPYQSREDDGKEIKAVNPAYLTDRNTRQKVAYYGPEAVGTIVVDPYARFLYYITGPGEAERYGIAVGREGKTFSGDATIERKAEYPKWTPTKNMIQEDPELYGPLKDGLPGGLDNPLGARALYLYRNGRDTYYRIHGTMDPSSIGRATSAGCIRLFNQDIIDLFKKVPKGTPVKVRTQAESLEYEGPVVQLHSGYVVSAYNQVAINEDEQAWKAGMIQDRAQVEAEQHQASVEMARQTAASGENANSRDCGYPGTEPCIATGTN